MSSHRDSRRSSGRRRLGSVRLRAVLSLGVAVGIGATGTLAAWTDNVSVTGTSFTAGRLDLKVNENDTSYSFTSVNLATMVPGSTTAGVLTIRNNGTVPLKYSATTTATNTDSTKNLLGALSVKVTGASATSGAKPAETCGGTTLAGTATTLSSAAPLVSTKRQLAAGATEYLCVQVTLSDTASTTLQGATATATFAFTGTSDLS